MAVRNSVGELSDSELSSIREAFSRAKEIMDERGYEYFAGSVAHIPSAVAKGMLNFD